ncbi:MAG: transposase family protein [Akkermansiaceae bacterium]|nr:transposase family protein [Akkermansiaceae bacterium]
MPRNPNKIDYSGGFPPGFEVFASIQDPRDGGNSRHHFGEILFIAFAAVLCGVRSYELMEEFAELREKWLRNWLELPNSIPCANSIPQTSTQAVGVWLKPRTLATTGRKPARSGSVTTSAGWPPRFAANGKTCPV